MCRFDRRHLRNNCYQNVRLPHSCHFRSKVLRYLDPENRCRFLTWHPDVPHAPSRRATVAAGGRWVSPASIPPRSAAGAPRRTTPAGRGRDSDWGSSAASFVAPAAEQPARTSRRMPALCAGSVACGAPSPERRRELPRLAGARFGGRPRTEVPRAPSQARKRSGRNNGRAKEMASG